MDESEIRQRIVAALEAGRVCELLDDERQQPVEVRAALLRQVLLDPKGEVDRRRGARFRGLHLGGRLVLAAGLLRFPLEFEECVFAGDVVVEAARLRSLTLRGCELGRLLADRLRCFGGLDLRGSKLVSVGLRGATVRGSLRLDGCKLEGAELDTGALGQPREAISAEGLSVGGEVSMRFLQAGATVNLRRSSLHQRLSALGAAIDGGGELALRLEGATVERNVDLKFGFEARGGVHMERVRIGGNLDCRGAHVAVSAATADLRDALDAHDAQIGGDVMLKAGLDGRGALHPFEAVGCVNLFRARIEGSLECHGAHFVALGRRGGELKRALDGEELQVTGSALLKVYDPAEDSNRSFRSQGEELQLLSCRTSGAVSFRRARLGRRLSLSGASLNEEAVGPLALLADDAVVERNVDLRRDARCGISFVANGTVDLDRVAVGGSIDCGGGQFHADERSFVESAGLAETPSHRQRSRALALRDARIAGSVYLSAPKQRDASVLDETPGLSFHAIGRVSLARCEIGGAVSLRRAHFERRVDAEPAAKEGTPNCLKLNDARIAGYLDLDQARFDGSWDAGEGARVGLPAVSIEARGVEIEGIVWLTHQLHENRDHRTDCELLFEGARVGKVLNHPRASWPRPGRLAIDGLRYDKLELWRPGDRIGRDDPRIWHHWLALQFPDGEDGDGFAAQPHEQLIAALRSMGLSEEARSLAVDKRTREIGALPRWARWLYRVLLGPIGYGHRPWAALKYLAALYVLGVVLFSAGWRTGAIQPAPMDVLVQQHLETAHTKVYGDDAEGHALPAEAYPEFNAAVYSADTFLPFIDLHQEAYWLPRRQPTPQRPAQMAWLLRFSYRILDAVAADWCRYYLWFHIAAGWVLMTITIAGLTGIVKTD